MHSRYFNLQSTPEICLKFFFSFCFIHSYFAYIENRKREHHILSRHHSLLLSYNLNNDISVDPSRRKCIPFNLQLAFVMVRPVKTAARAAFLELELLAAHAYQDTAGVRALVSKNRYTNEFRKS